MNAPDKPSADKEVEILNDLIASCFEDAAEQRAASVAGEDEARAARLLARARELYRTAKALQRIVLQRGAQPEDEDNLLRPSLLRAAQANYARGKAAVRSRLSHAGVRMESLRSDAIEAFRQVLASQKLSPALRQALEAQYQRLRASWDGLTKAGALKYS